MTVTAAQEEFDLAVIFREIWKPAAFDSGLHRRMEHSYAGHAFLAIRSALRRETLLALTRLWDTNKQAVRMSAIAALLREPGLVAALAQDRADRTGFTGLFAALTTDMAGKAAKILDLVNKYSEGGSGNGVREDLVRLRHERLAHRQFAPAPEIAADGLDARIEEFFDDASKLIQLLMSLVNATAYEPQDTAKVYQWHADKFWAGARSERVKRYPHELRPGTKHDPTVRRSTLSRQLITSGYPFEDEYGYSRAVRVGNQVFISGTTARPPHLDGDAYTQVRAVLEGPNPTSLLPAAK